MREVWKKVDSLSWDEDDGKTEIERLKGEGLTPVEPIEPEPVLNEQAYLILCEIRDGKREEEPQDTTESLKRET